MNAANSNEALGAPLWGYIELSGGKVTAATIEGEGGTRPILADIGKFRFSVEVVDASGGRLVLESLDDYEAAIRAAEKARIAFDIDGPVRDTIAGSH